MTANRTLKKLLLASALFAAGAYFHQSCNSSETTSKKDLENVVEKNYQEKKPVYRTTKVNTHDIITREEFLEYLHERNNEKTPSVQSYRALRKHFSQKRDQLEEVLEDEDYVEDFPPYYIPPEERDFETADEPLTYFNEALKAKHYRIAESYIKDIQKHFPNAKEIVKNTLREDIEEDYDNYLTNVIENCEKNDSASVKIKNAYMDVFFFPNGDNEEKRINFYNKGQEALEIMNKCIYE